MVDRWRTLDVGPALLGLLVQEVVWLAALAGLEIGAAGEGASYGSVDFCATPENVWDRFVA